MEVGKRTIKRFGKQVKIFRQEKGWTQELFADELQVDRSYVSSLERGLRNPTLKTIARIAAIFGVSVSDLCADV
jgi:transcriptional regulator with XRE-family HTH domain